MVWQLYDVNKHNPALYKMEKAPHKSAKDPHVGLIISFSADCQQFLNDFKKREDLSYKVFAKLWRTKGFSGIFLRRSNIMQLAKFIENAYLVVKEYLYSSDLMIQTGAFFLLYGICYKQPIRTWIKIRLTKRDVSQIRTIIGLHKGLRNFESAFIYHKMLKEGALKLCALPNVLTLEITNIAQYSQLQFQFSTQQRNPLTLFQALTKDPIVKDIENTNREYSRLVKKYKKKTFQLAVFPSIILQQMTETEERVSAIESGAVEELPSEEKRTINSIKKRAMSNKHAVYRAEKMHSAPSSSKE